MDTRETLAYQRESDNDLLADIYYPLENDDASQARPVGEIVTNKYSLYSHR